jgi:plasmid stabilization system protein ParE
MRVGYHPAVQRDVGGILRYYDGTSPALGDAFWAELIKGIEAARLHPDRHHLVLGELRRVNLTRFPYHFLYRTTAWGIRVMVVRHHRRHPGYGTRRQ